MIIGLFYKTHLIKKTFQYQILIIANLLFLSSYLLAQNETKFEIEKYEIEDVKIEFKGTQSFDDDKILDVIKSSNEEYFDREEFVLDAERIERFYFDNGFWDVIVDTSLVMNHKDIEVTETFIIHENSRYDINKIKYIGLDNLNSDLINIIFKENTPDIAIHQPYSRNNLNKEIFRLINIFHNNGYANASSEPPEVIKIISENPDLKHKLNLILVFKPGSKFKFGRTKINIENNKYNISKHDISRELVYKENETYSKEKLVKSENRISKISIIENGRIQIDNIDTIDHVINFKINVILTNKYEFSPEIFGYEVYKRFYGGAGFAFIDRYFFGGGRTFTSEIKGLFHSIDIYGFDLSAQISQPYIFNNYYLTGNYKFGATIFSEDSIRISGIANTFSVNYELPTYTYINNLILDWKIENVRITFTEDIREPDSNEIVIPADANIDIFSSILGFSAVHNNTNDFIFPSYGYIQVYSIEESGLIGGLLKKILKVSTVSYFKLTMLNKFYFNISRFPDNISNSVLATKFLTGSLFEYGDNKIQFNELEQEIEWDYIPTEARFVCGGSTSVRGWGAMELGIIPYKRFGGNFIIEGSLEHRTKPFMKTKGLFKDLGFVTFFDYGNVWTEIQKFKLNEIALAIGGGLRYYTIIGPIRLDLGLKLYDPQPGPDGGSNWLFGKGAHLGDKYTIQFGIGNTF